jgi:acyl-CoA synthetase (AMP-forming)/AMP-acid ligase II
MTISEACEIDHSVATWTTLVSMCRERAAAAPDRKSFVFLGNDLEEIDSLTLSQLDQQARTIAMRLSEVAEPGARALLNYQPGLEFISAFFGCLYAGVIAVPIAPLENGRDDVKLRRVGAISASCKPEILLSTSAVLEGIGQPARDVSGLRGLTEIATDELDPALGKAWTDLALTGDTVAYLQYSSGSTGLPKGVVITHRNVLSNLALIHENGAREDGQASAAVVLWLPLFHDMGLVNAVLQPLFVGYDSILMSALTFVQRPFNWLKAISQAGFAISAAPNMAFDLCVQRITEEQRAQLDLSNWHLAAVGAEPVRAETLDRFCEMFASCGFRRETIFPCYGLAEATVMVSGGPAGHAPVVLRLDADELARGRATTAAEGARVREMVGCGQIQPTMKVVMVSPVTGRPCATDEIGEIYVASASVGDGYWEAAGPTEDTFRAVLADYPGVSFLRTGDLGFVRDGQLFVTGRLKDVIILSGMNYYPNDVELTVSSAHPAIRPGFCCAFSIEDGKQEKLVVLAEMSRTRPPAPSADSGSGGGQDPDLAGIKTAIARAVTAQHGIRVDEVALLKMGSLPFTSSAKIQRLESRSRFQSGGFDDKRLG